MWSYRAAGFDALVAITVHTLGSRLCNPSALCRDIWKHGERHVILGDPEHQKNGRRTALSVKCKRP